LKSAEKPEALDRQGTNPLTGSLKTEKYKEIFFEENGDLKNIRSRKLQFPLFLLIVIFLLAQDLGAGDLAILMGRVSDADQQPLSGVRIELTSKDTLFRSTAVSDLEGFFALNGIPHGEYHLLLERDDYQPLAEAGILFEPSRLLYVQATLHSKANPSPPQASTWTDLSNFSARTIIDDRQIQTFPSAENAWSLIENQDLSATTNRIDVGGVWASLPALWSSRGGVSWTQSAYLINGLDVTDPYWGGQPLFYPDIFSIEFARHDNGQNGIQHLSPGGAFDIVPEEGTSEIHGSVSAYWTFKGMTSSNITPALEAGGLRESHKLNSFQDYNVQLSGPLLPGRLYAYTSFSHLSVNRDIAEFEADDRGSVTSGLVNLTYRLPESSLKFFWTGQDVRHPTLGAARKVPFSSTLDQQSGFHVAQGIWQARIRSGHIFRAGVSYSRGRIESQFQEGVKEPHRLEIFQRTPVGAAAAAGEDTRSTLALFAKGEALLSPHFGYSHRFEYGLVLRRSSADSSREIVDNIHLHYYDGEPFEIVRFNSPARHQERGMDVQVFAQDSITFKNRASLSFGLHLVSTRGWVPGSESTGKIRWLNLSPRLSFAYPFLPGKSLTIRLSAARYYFRLPLYLLTYGNPGALGGEAFPWLDANRDGRFQEGEAGERWRREGPYYGTIDPNLKRPHTDEYSVALTKSFKKDLYLTLAGFYRESRQLIETLNTGVPLTAYDPVEIYDPGDDFIPGNHDDLVLTVYNQKKETLGDDFFILSNPFADSRVSRYRGVDLTLVKRCSRGQVFFFSATATEAIGTTSPGNSELENDDGVVGKLYDTPNASLFARGRLRFDRAYTARLGTSLIIPLDFRLAALVKYYDGQPFSRKIIVSGFNQGPFYVQAFYRGQARYEFNMTVDLRLEKTIAFGRSRARVFLDGYNIFNWALATEENEWTGPEFVLRFATEVQSPRVFRIGVSYEF
jgi:hypothetical protein